MFGRCVCLFIVYATVLFVCHSVFFQLYKNCSGRCSVRSKFFAICYCCFKSHTHTVQAYTYQQPLTVCCRLSLNNYDRKKQREELHLQTRQLHRNQFCFCVNFVFASTKIIRIVNIDRVNQTIEQKQTVNRKGNSEASGTKTTRILCV